MPVTDPTLIGETIPIRLFLGGFDLTPTFREVNKKYSTRYYLSLVLIDEGPLPLLLYPLLDASSIPSPSLSLYPQVGNPLLTSLTHPQMPVATSSNPKSSFTDKRPKSPPHNYTKRSRSLSKSLERPDENSRAYYPVLARTCI